MGPTPVHGPLLTFRAGVYVATPTTRFSNRLTAGEQAEGIVSTGDTGEHAAALVPYATTQRQLIKYYDRSMQPYKWISRMTRLRGHDADGHERGGLQGTVREIDLVGNTLRRRRRRGLASSVREGRDPIRRSTTTSETRTVTRSARKRRTPVVQRSGPG